MVYAIAGRPATGKTRYIQRLGDQMGGGLLSVSAYDYPGLDELVNDLAKRLMDGDKLKAVAVDDLEPWLIKSWNSAVDEAAYRKSLQILAGLAESFNVDLYFSVGLKREADRETNIYCSGRFLRSKAIIEETDGVFYMKRTS